MPETVMTKAQRLPVRLLHHDQRVTIADVTGDHGTYRVNVVRGDNLDAARLWCSCPSRWEACSHVLAYSPSTLISAFDRSGIINPRQRIVLQSLLKPLYLGVSVVLFWIGDHELQRGSQALDYVPQLVAREHDGVSYRHHPFKAGIAWQLFRLLRFWDNFVQVRH